MSSHYSTITITLSWLTMFVQCPMSNAHWHQVYHYFFVMSCHVMCLLFIACCICCVFLPLLFTVLFTVLFHVLFTTLVMHEFNNAIVINYDTISCDSTHVEVYKSTILVMCVYLSFNNNVNKVIWYQLVPTSTNHLIIIRHIRNQIVVDTLINSYCH